MSKRVPVKRVHKDYQNGSSYAGGIQPILYPGSRMPGANASHPSDGNVLRAKNWVDYNNK